MPCEIIFQAGGIVVTGDRSFCEWIEGHREFVADPRVDGYRASASAYRKLITALHRDGIAYEDKARAYVSLACDLQSDKQPFAYQREALEAWLNHSACGIVVLPTGAGKSYVAQLAIQNKKRSTLVVCPTIDLMRQWYTNLGQAFGTEIGLLGGGFREIRDITVTTYDSAYIHMEHIGNRWGLLIFDEVHHLPTSTYALGALHALAPFRLGLTATPERDESQYRYEDLVGPVVYSKAIKDLAGKNLAKYEILRLDVNLNDEERRQYEEARETYLRFIRENGIRMSSPAGWSEFIKVAAGSREGREALACHRLQKSITQTCEAKIAQVKKLLDLHRDDRIIIFTADNATVYRISSTFLIPAITHKSNVKERAEILQRFNRGEYPVVVTSKVLNEGVDVPEAGVAIILSGSGSVREHVQRLGRVLRAKAGKIAVLYELIAKNTSEESTGKRRRDHEAYK